MFTWVSRAGLPLALALALTAGTAGCGKKKSDGGAAAGGGKAAEAGGHEHKPKMGGSLGTVGNHEYLVEVVHDPAEGRLTLYMLDAHAENFVRCGAETVKADLALPTGNKRITLNATARSETGETVGDTSQFDGAAEWLKGVGEFDLTLPGFSLEGKSYSDVTVHVGPKGK